MFTANFRERNSSIELFRFFSMVGIVVYHCILWGTNKNYGYIYNLGTNCDTAFHLSFYSLGNAGVTSFMFLSGWFGVKLNIRKIVDIIMMMLFYLIIVRYYAGVSTLKIIALSLHPWDGWWFVRCYLLICVLSPIINLGIERISKKKFTSIIVLVTIYTYFGHALSLKSEMNTDLLLSIFLWGRYLRKYPPQFSQKYIAWLCFISTISISLLPIIISTTGNTTLMSLFISNNNFLYVIFAASFTMWLEKHQFNSGIINWLASSTLAIYIITDNELREYLDPWLFRNVMDNPLVGYTIVFLLCLGCLLIEKIRVILFYPLTTWINKSLTITYSNECH